jgi:hypothetical protein
MVYTTDDAMKEIQRKSDEYPKEDVHDWMYKWILLATIVIILFFIFWRIMKNRR